MFERDFYIGIDDHRRCEGPPRWRLKLHGERWELSRWLILTPTPSNWYHHLTAHVEDDQRGLFLKTKNLGKRLTRKTLEGAHSGITPHVVQHSHREIKIEEPFEGIAIQALNCTDDNLKQSILHCLFQKHFVNDDSGLAYIKRYSATAANYYAQTRLRKYESSRDSTNDERTYEVRHAIGLAHETHESVNSVGFNGPTANCYNGHLAERLQAHVCSDAVLRDAFDAILVTNEPDEVKQRQVWQLVIDQATEADCVFSAVMALTQHDHAYLGLRILQAIEHGSMLIPEAAAIALNPKTTCPAKRRELGNLLRRGKDSKNV